MKQSVTAQISQYRWRGRFPLVQSVPDSFEPSKQWQFRWQWEGKNRPSQLPLSVSEWKIAESSAGDLASSRTNVASWGTEWAAVDDVCWGRQSLPSAATERFLTACSAPVCSRSRFELKFHFYYLTATFNLLPLATACCQDRQCWLSVESLAVSCRAPNGSEEYEHQLEQALSELISERSNSSRWSDGSLSIGYN